MFEIWVIRRACRSLLELFFNFVDRRDGFLFNSISGRIEISGGTGFLG
jgi:hypothetical protein